MKLKATSVEEILSSSRKIVQEKGLSGISMRSVAAEAGVATGTLYHYFPDKDALMLAVTADIWEDIFDLEALGKNGQGFSEAVSLLFRHASEKIEAYPGFLELHGTDLAGKGGAAKEGAARMHAFFRKIEGYLLSALERDRRVRPDAFDAGMSEEGFVSFVLEHLITLLALGRKDCSVLTAVIDRVLY
jgi:AcrR family transcriptional regulator